MHSERGKFASARGRGRAIKKFLKFDITAHRGDRNRPREKFFTGFGNSRKYAG